MKHCTKKGTTNNTPDCDECGAVGYTFNRMAEWVCGIRALESGKFCAYDNWLGIEHGSLAEYNKRRDELLCSAALINIKKANGGKRSSQSELLCIAREDADLLRRQIEIVDPSLIICGGTYEMLKCVYNELPSLEDSRDGCTRLGDIGIIAACHPCYPRKSGAEKYKVVIQRCEHLRADCSDKT